MNAKQVQFTSVEMIDKQISDLENRKALIVKLNKEKENLEQQINQVLGGGVVGSVTASNFPAQKEGRKVRELVLPRGVLTMATFTALASSKSAMPCEKLIEGVKSSPLLKGNVPTDIEKRVRGLLAASSQFRSVGNDKYTTTAPKLKGRLFERLGASVAA